jgi:hypothetical protein
MTTYIHIKAVCPYFSVYEIISQSKAVKRLENIRSHFLWYNAQSKFYDKYPEAKLSVTTGVVNPELPLRN